MGKRETTMVNLKNFRGRTCLMEAAVACTLAAPAGASSLAVIYNANNDETGSGSLGTPLPVSYGQVAGVLSTGGAENHGELFVLTPGKKGAYTKTIVHTFTLENAQTDGLIPSNNLVADKAGNVWVTTVDNGPNETGTLGEMVKPASKGGAWTYRTVFAMPASFDHNNGGGGYYDMLFDPKGDLYGVIAGAITGGADGAIWTLTEADLASGTGTPAIVYTFPGADNSNPTGLARDKQGNLYGYEPTGGPSGNGVLWEVSPPAKHKGAWTRQNIYNFCSVVDQWGGCVDGNAPQGSPAIDKNGVVYGATYEGGGDLLIGCCLSNSNGVIFSMVPPVNGGTGSYSVLHFLNDYNTDGSPSSDWWIHNPTDGVILSKTGQVLTATYTGGAGYPNAAPIIEGAVISVDPTSGADSIVNNGFAPGGQSDCGPGGVTPNSELRLDSKGRIYGATLTYAASDNCQVSVNGVIFQMTP
jgi:hypothetical protein